MAEIERLQDIMRALRDPDSGCPWDIKQNMQSITPYTIEEAYEIADAIERGDMHDLKDELGDLLFHVVFYAQMASEQQAFCFDDVVRAINDKLVRRHPHVFADDQAGSDEELLKAWEQQKASEREGKEKPDETGSALDGIASTLPALKWAEKIQKRAAHTGFDWDQLAPVFAKLHEEIDELKQEVAVENNHERIVDELGDVLFSCVNLSRHLDVSAEQALRQGNQKFIGRFRQMEKLIAGKGRVISDYSLAELEQQWQKAKSCED
ncbi:MAG: nucleoside triphosphate pyrophosphohydrolase [Gammaproteobacteria bacterium]|nr:nucleoside triphosphate pyrophosphohydrolase [Gammaproteobacteria bacterium]MCW8923136.1 nucleoside triphosphate pyrophosphohydrolase [Gammaproteobacteria bacterium]